MNEGWLHYFSHRAVSMKVKGKITGKGLEWCLECNDPGAAAIQCWWVTVVRGVNRHRKVGALTWADSGRKAPGFLAASLTHSPEMQTPWRLPPGRSICTCSSFKTTPADASVYIPGSQTHVANTNSCLGPAALTGSLHTLLIEKSLVLSGLLQFISAMTLTSDSTPLCW